VLEKLRAYPSETLIPIDKAIAMSRNKWLTAATC